MKVHIWSSRWSLSPKCKTFLSLNWRSWLFVSQCHTHPSSLARVVGMKRPSSRDPGVFSKHNSNLNMNFTKVSAFTLCILPPQEVFKESFKMDSGYSLVVKPCSGNPMELLSLNLSQLNRIRWPITHWQNQCKSTTMKSKSVKKMMFPESCRHSATALCLSSTSRFSGPKSSRYVIKSGTFASWQNDENVCQLINGFLDVAISNPQGQASVHYTPQKTGGSFSSMTWVFVWNKTSYVARRMRGCCIYGNGLWWQI